MIAHVRRIVTRAAGSSEGRDSPSNQPPAERSSLIPATSVMLMGLELKMACPRATAARGFAGGSSAHAWKGI
jgi:hypothetical protein